MVDIEKLRALLERATKGPWMVQDGCSWRRIGTHWNDGNVLSPTNGRLDGHPDLIAEQGRRDDNLSLIVAAVNELPALLDELERKTKALGVIAGSMFKNDLPQREMQNVAKAALKGTPND